MEGGERVGEQGRKLRDAAALLGELLRCILHVERPGPRQYRARAAQYLHLQAFRIHDQQVDDRPRCRDRFIERGDGHFDLAALAHPAVAGIDRVLGKARRPRRSADRTRLDTHAGKVVQQQVHREQPAIARTRLECQHRSGPASARQRNQHTAKMSAHDDEPRARRDQRLEQRNLRPVVFTALEQAARYVEITGIDGEQPILRLGHERNAVPGQHARAPAGPQPA